jgi:bile acid-coenzyme A ligase
MISFIQRLEDLTAEAPLAPAITCAGDSMSRTDLLKAGYNLAVYLHNQGVREDDMVTVAVPNSIDFFIAYIAAWRLGATPQPISSRLPQRELDAIIELANSSAVIGVEEGSVASRVCVPTGFRAPDADASHLPYVLSKAWKAPTSGGSTGRP